MSDLTGAVAPIELDGVEYSVSPLSDRDKDEVNNWLRASTLRIATDAITDEMPQRVVDSLLRAAVVESRRIDFMSPEAAPLMRTPSSLARVFYQSALAKHPDLTYEKARKLLSSPDNLVRFAGVLAGILGMPRALPPNSPGSSSTAP